MNLVVEEGIAAAEVAGSYLYEVEIRVVFPDALRLTSRSSSPESIF